MIDAVIRALEMALAMGWEILWPLILGFALSGVVQAAVSHQQMSQLLPDDRPRSIATALALGAASSSCSYAAVALARSIFRKGAHFTAAMAFEMSSTNLVLELTIIMVALLGWQLTLAEFFGAPLMVVLLVLLFRMFLNRELLDQARKQADKGIVGRMEGHAEMDMSVTEGGSLWQRMTSDRGRTAISHHGCLRQHIYDELEKDGRIIREERRRNGFHGHSPSESQLAVRVGPGVRIRLAPAGSLQTFSSSRAATAMALDRLRRRHAGLSGEGASEMARAHPRADGQTVDRKPFVEPLARPGQYWRKSTAAEVRGKCAPPQTATAKFTRSPHRRDRPCWEERSSPAPWRS